jgi:hypothetical protein
MAADPVQEALDRLTANHERIVKYFHEWRQPGAKDHNVMGLTSPDGSGYLNFEFRRSDGTLCELSLHPAIVRRESHDEVVIASARFDDDTAARLAWQEMHRVQVHEHRQQVGLHELPPASGEA